jgi:hypothetical protein
MSARTTRVVEENREQRGLAGDPVGASASFPRQADETAVAIRSAEAALAFPQPTADSNHPSVKTYLIYPKTGRPLRVEAETIGFVRDGVVVLHNIEGQPIAVIPVAETAGVIEERSVISSEEPAPKAKGRVTSKAEVS